MSKVGNRSGLKTFRQITILVLPVFLSACLYLDLGTVLSLRKLDPYSVDLIASRAAVLVPPDVDYAPNVDVTLRITRNGEVLQEEIFALEVVKDGEALDGINVEALGAKPLVIRLAKADYARANAVQAKLAKKDKNHQWVEPGNDTVGGADKASEDGIERAVADDEAASGDLTINWQFSLRPQGKEKYCQDRKKIRLTAWVKINDAPFYRRVVHGMPLKKVFGKAGMKRLCASDNDPAQVD
jgi:hypothetical protein